MLLLYIRIEALDPRKLFAHQAPSLIMTRKDAPISLSPNEMKSITRRFVLEPWAAGKLDTLDETCAPNYVLGSGDTLQSLKQAIQETRTAVPNLGVTIGEMVAEGDWIAYQWTMRGTHQGPYHGLAPTGKPVSFSGMTMLHFANGKIDRDQFEISSPSLEAQISK